MPSPASTATATSKAAEEGAAPPVIQSQDLVASLPAPVLRLLILFAWPISIIRTCLEVLFWKSGRRVESWMTLGAWWAICLGSSHAFKYLLPPIIFAPLIPLASLRISSKKTIPIRQSITQPATPDTLLKTISDLHCIYALLPPSPIPTASTIYARFRLLGTLRLCRGLLVVWVTWVLLGRFIGYRSLLAIGGSIILLLPSPPLAQLFNLLSKSLAIRRAVALAFLFTFGSPPDQAYRFHLSFSPLEWAKSKWAVSRRPSLAFAFRPKMGNLGTLGGSAIEDDGPEEKAGNPIYFMFEVQENQRWWMGLDWTSALLPQERPSWCDSHLLPVSPPPSFPLPPAASVILPAPTKTDPNAKVKRTATWRWLDDDWSVVRTSATSGSVPLAPQNPPITEEDQDNTSGFSLNGNQSTRPLSGSFSFGSSPPSNTVATASADDGVPTGTRSQSIAEQAFTKGLERLKARTTSPAGGMVARTVGGSPGKTGERGRARTGSQASEDVIEDLPLAMNATVEVDGVTDQDGWVYGDNKWEGMSPRGGLGKFTRRRRWHRRAVCTETIQRISSEDSATALSTPTPVGNTKLFDGRPSSPIISRKSDIKARASLEEDRGNVSGISNGMASGVGGAARDDQLRLRLKKAMGSVGA